MGLLPKTLAEFWGAHAAAWAATTAFFAVSVSVGGGAGWVLSALLSALSATSLSLAVLLGRNREEAGVALSLTASAYFTGTSALLHAAAATVATAAAGTAWLGLMRRLRTWHALLAAGSLGFAIKAANKDRAFGGAAGTRGLPLPTLALINSAAGAKMGEALAASLREEAARRADGGEAPLEVVNLEDVPPREALRSFGERHPQYRVLVCGGDGSVAWVLGEVEQLDAPYRPAVAILPLGTGNDMSRVLGWGKYFRPQSLRARLAALSLSRVALLDRWGLAGSLPDGREQLVMSNYLSIGVDARASLNWARLKAAAPALFSLRLLAKLWYIVLGTPELLLRSHRDLPSRLTLTCDGQRIPLPRRCQGLMVCNTPSYGGGSDLWDPTQGAPLPSRDRMQTEAVPPAADDGVLEIVCVTGVFHLAQTLAGFSNAVRLAQGREVSIEVEGSGVPLQVDGEPFGVASSGVSSLGPFSLTLRRLGTSLMLRAPAGGIDAADGEAGPSAVEGAMADGLISHEVREELLEKMARAS